MPTKKSSTVAEKAVVTTPLQSVAVVKAAREHGREMGLHEARTLVMHLWKTELFNGHYERAMALMEADTSISKVLRDILDKSIPARLLPQDLTTESA